MLRKADFWERNRNVSFNERQRKLINLQFDGFFGKLSTGKWAKIAKCSTDTALNDIRDLVGKGILKKAEEGGRSTNYVMVEWVWKVLWMKLQIFIALSSKNAASKVVKRMKSIGHEMETIKQVTGLTEKEIETI